MTATDYFLILIAVTVINAFTWIVMNRLEKDPKKVSSLQAELTELHNKYFVLLNKEHAELVTEVADNLRELAATGTEADKGKYLIEFSGSVIVAKEEIWQGLGMPEPITLADVVAEVKDSVSSPDELFSEWRFNDVLKVYVSEVGCKDAQLIDWRT